MNVGPVLSNNLSLFRKNSSIGQLNVQVATAENEEHTSWVTYYTLHFKIVTLFFQVFFEADVLKR